MIAIDLKRHGRGVPASAKLADGLSKQDWYQMMFALLLVLAATPEASVRRFGDWFVACDNGRACIAGSLRLDDDEATAVVMLRQAATGTAAPEIAVQLPQGMPTPTRFAVDGLPLTLHPRRNDDRLIFPVGEARQLVASMRKGDRLVFGDTNGKPLATASLAGAMATLLAIDEVQHRADTVAALGRLGPASAQAIPSAPPLPRIPAIRMPGRAGPALSAARVAVLRADAECDDADGDARTYPLDGQHSLALIACDTGAYNFTSLAVTIDRAGHLGDAPFDWEDTDDDGNLVNAAFRNGILSTFMKGRGPGDCGHSRRYVWDGRRFVTIEIARQDECGGNPDWPILYRAVPVWRGD